VKSAFFFASKRNKIFASISNFASEAKVRAHPTWKGYFGKNSISFSSSSGIIFLLYTPFDSSTAFRVLFIFQMQKLVHLDPGPDNFP
jgi:hypothetical protein